MTDNALVQKARLESGGSWLRRELTNTTTPEDRERLKQMFEAALTSPKSGRADGGKLTRESEGRGRQMESKYSTNPKKAEPFKNER